MRDLAAFPTPYTRTGELDSPVRVVGVPIQSQDTLTSVCLSCGLLSAAPPQGRHPWRCRCGSAAFLSISSSPGPHQQQPGDNNEPADESCTINFDEYVALLPRLLTVPPAPAVNAPEWLLDWVSHVQDLSRHDIKARKGSKRCPDLVQVSPWDGNQQGYASIPVISNSSWAFTYTNNLPHDFSSIQGRVHDVRRSGPIAEWIAQHEGPPPTFYVLAKLCPQCGRPWAPGASYHALHVPSNVWQPGYEFCPRLARAPSIRTRLLAGSASSGFEGILLPRVVNVTAPPVGDPVNSAPSYVLNGAELVCDRSD